MIQSDLKIQLCNIIAVDVCAITVFFSIFKISSVFFKTFILKIKKSKQANAKNKETNKQTKNTKQNQTETSQKPNVVIDLIFKNRRLRVSSPIEATFLIISK